jgi:hypothetical protein
MHSTRMVSAVFAAGLFAGTGAFAQNGTPINSHSKNALTVAVYGDAPYGLNPTDTIQIDKTSAFIASINADPKVDLVLHVGDIHSGKQYCTEAYDRGIYDLWTAFKDPLIYTPGDNEWSDCHKSGEGGHAYVDSPTNSIPVDYADGNPIANLDLVRSIFFANPGYSLGGRKKRVLTQAENYDLAHPIDGNYVENVMWEQSRVLFVTINVPGGSNNDNVNWFGRARTQAQTDEIVQRTQADLDWLDAAFAQAQKDGVEGVVIQAQADMWDLDSKPVTHLVNYEPFIASISTHTQTFGKPVLLFNGDSHHYRSDNPLEQGQPCVFEAASGTGTVACSSIPAAADFTPDAWDNHPGYKVPNFHRVVVHGSTEPLEWLRLTITPSATADAGANAFGPFTWERIDPLP